LAVIAAALILPLPSSYLSKRLASAKLVAVSSKSPSLGFKSLSASAKAL